jgi:zinc/manganese transport system permease protein
VSGLVLILPAFAAGLLVLASHVPLGRRVLARGIIFIDITIAQFAALGMVIAHAAHIENAWLTQLAALGAALLGALLFQLSERLWPDIQEALIGSGFVLASSLSILLLARDPHGGEHLQELLVGQILWTGWGDLWPLLIASLLALGLWQSPQLRQSTPVFYLLFALLITLSVQQIGVFLVFASLILPALAVRAWSGRRALFGAYAIGAAGYALGLLGSLYWDLPAGALIVCTLAALGAPFLAVSGQQHAQPHEGKKEGKKPL